MAVVVVLPAALQAQTVQEKVEPAKKITVEAAEVLKYKAAAGVDEQAAA